MGKKIEQGPKLGQKIPISQEVKTTLEMNVQALRLLEMDAVQMQRRAEYLRKSTMATLRKYSRSIKK